MTDAAAKTVALIGGGGHARVVADALDALGFTIGHVVDPRPAHWLMAHRVASDDAAVAQLDPAKTLVALGLGGVDPAALDRRLTMAKRYALAGFTLLTVVHPSAATSPNARIGAGAFVGPGAVVNAGSRIGLGAIVNSGAVVEHDADVGDGSHIAPHATVLGGARVGVAAMIGAGAVILPGADVFDRTIVPALALHRSAAHAIPRETAR